MSKIAIIRMKGKFTLSPHVRATLSSFRLNRLYSCALAEDNPSTKGMLQRCKDSVAFGAVDAEAIRLLLSTRGFSADIKRLTAVKKPEEIEKMAQELSSSGKSLSDLGVRPLFFLSPPRGGFGASRKDHAPKGPLGKNEGIAILLAKMS